MKTRETTFAFMLIRGSTVSVSCQNINYCIPCLAADGPRCGMLSTWRVGVSETFKRYLRWLLRVSLKPLTTKTKDFLFELWAQVCSMILQSEIICHHRYCFQQSKDPSCSGQSKSKVLTVWYSFISTCTALRALRLWLIIPALGDDHGWPWMTIFGKINHVFDP